MLRSPRWHRQGFALCANSPLSRDVPWRPPAHLRRLILEGSRGRGKTPRRSRAHSLGRRALRRQRVKVKSCAVDHVYDSNSWRCWLRSRRIEPVIPSRRNRLVQMKIGGRLYRQRYRIEALFHRIKRWRQVATRFEKRAKTYLRIVPGAAIGISSLCTHPLDTGLIPRATR